MKTRVRLPLRVAASSAASIYQIITGATTGTFANPTVADPAAFSLGSGEYVWTAPLGSHTFRLKPGSVALVPIAVHEPAAFLLGGNGVLRLLGRRRTP